MEPVGSQQVSKTACHMGAEAAMAPSTTAGYFIRNQPASIPPSGAIDSGVWRDRWRGMA